MKKTNQTLAALAIFTVLAASAQASTITAGDSLAGGISYEYYVEMGGSDSGSLTAHVGSWSWNNGALTPPVGWTHTSTFVALTLTEPVVFTLKMESWEGVPWPSTDFPNRTASTAAMFPSFTIWTGLDNDGSETHTYSSVGNISWAEDITYLDHYNNGTLSSIERSWVLPAGTYTIALGSNAPASNPNEQGYKASFTTTAVPEPSTIALIAGSLGALALIRRRKRA
jgi:hypothetical protein